MDIQAECVSCMMDQVRKALIRFRPEITNLEIVEIQKKIMIRFGNKKERHAAYYGQLIYRSISDILGEYDPYKQLKEKYNRIAIDLIPRLNTFLTNSKNPLLEAINISILGNVIDFGTPHVIDLEKEIEQYSLSNLKINHFPDLKKDIEDRNTKNILIIGDNAGEIVFDRILVDLLVRTYPEKRIIYAVRGGPAINDATIKDAEDVGMTKICKVVEGSHSPGVILKETSMEFQKEFKDADIILSKGQGNFESLDNVVTNGQLYFLLKTKCQLVADMFRVPLGSLVLFHRIDLNRFSR